MADAERAGGSYPILDGETKWIGINQDSLLIDFTFSIPRSTVVSFAASTTAYQSSVIFMIQDENGKVHILGSAEYSSDMLAHPVSLPAGSYTVTALVDADYSGSLGFVYAAIPGMDEYGDEYVYEYESNGSAEDATPLDTHQNAIGFLYNSMMDGTTDEVADLDMYSFTLSRATPVRIELVCVPGVMFALQNANGDTLIFGLDADEKALVGQTPYHGGSLDEGTVGFLTAACFQRRLTT